MLIFKRRKNIVRGDAFHEKSEKNSKVKLERNELEKIRNKKFKKPKTRGQKVRGRKK